MSKASAPSKQKKQTRARGSLGWDAAREIVDWLFFTMDAHNISKETLSEATGISIETIKSWKKTEKLPRLEQICNCVGYLKHDLIPMKDPILIGEDLIHRPVLLFRQHLLETKLTYEARRRKRPVEKYIADQSGELAERAAKANSKNSRKRWNSF
jgi:transcriptional regulator with XRE-family HTH domain